MRPYFVGVLFTLTACATPTGVDGPVAVRAVRPDLQVTNHTLMPVYTMVIERGTTALIDWAPCTDPTRCAAVAPGGMTRVPYSQIAGYTSTARWAVAYWWHLIPNGSTAYRPDSIRAILVML